jgi:hypothetical protein
MIRYTDTQIGPSALVGFSLFVLLGPLQTWFMKLAFVIRKKSMVRVLLHLASSPGLHSEMD